jgi:AraC-like DNA-binding protein
LELIKKSLPFQQAVVLTSVPRGGLQLCQPAGLPLGLTKACVQGAHAMDRLSWQSILRKKPVQPPDVESRESFLGGEYSRQFMIPAHLEHVVAFPLAAPIFQGYPGSLHLLRSGEQGPFKASPISAVMSAIKGFDQRLAAARSPRKGDTHDGSISPGASRRPAGLVIVDAKMRVQSGGEAWAGLDSHLKEQISAYTKRRFQQLSRHGLLADRAHFPDTLSNVWACRVVAYKRYPALGEGAFAFLCMQPTCSEWMSLRAADFAADPDLARLIPSLKFMQRAFRDGPTLVSIAGVANLSPFHFHRRFTELLGMTPKQFMLDCQIHEAKAELISGKTELIDIARDCGFAHQSHFTSRFRQATGHTPTRWRRAVRAMS